MSAGRLPRSACPVCLPYWILTKVSFAWLSYRDFLVSSVISEERYLAHDYFSKKLCSFWNDIDCCIRRQILELQIPCCPHCMHDASAILIIERWISVSAKPYSAGHEFLPIIAVATQSLTSPSSQASEDSASLFCSLQVCLESISSSARIQRFCILREGDRCPQEAEVIHI